MARDVDWLIVIAPGSPATRGLVSRAVLEALGPTGAFVNVARGALIDEPALVDLPPRRPPRRRRPRRLRRRAPVPAALLTLDNVVLSPHQGSATSKTRDAMGALVVRNLAAHFAGEPLPTAVV